MKAKWMEPKSKKHPLSWPTSNQFLFLGNRDVYKDKVKIASVRTHAFACPSNPLQTWNWAIFTSRYHLLVAPVFRPAFSFSISDWLICEIFNFTLLIFSVISYIIIVGIIIDTYYLRENIIWFKVNF